MVLQSNLFTKPRNDKLERCAIKDTDHITPGAVGEHVKLIQIALNQLSNVFLKIDGIYGPGTAAAVKAYKNAPSRRILQPWQTTADDIVGIRTIQSLDAEMYKLENAPPVLTGYVSETYTGTPHDHDKCVPYLDSEDHMTPNGYRISHKGTPIYPQGWGRKIAMGGTNEVKYLGFENFMPDPKEDPYLAKHPEWIMGRPLTSSLPDHCASDICFRSAPIDAYMQAGELKRIAAPGCRLTYAGNLALVTEYTPFLLSLGPQVQYTYIVPETVPPGTSIFTFGMGVVVISMTNVR